MKLSANWLESESSAAVTGMLERAGHQALFVGGCVRNALLDRPVSDLDLSTDALPEQVMALAKGAGLKAIPTGIDHGTVTVIAGGTPFEITTFRRDVETDGRRAVVAFSTDLKDDARRRDFTMNALYCDARGAVVDPLGGIDDLHARRVVFIENPQRRIQEDYLRILRFFRFTAWYGDGIDPEGLAACAELADGLDQIAKERIGHEMLKLLGAADPAPACAAMEISGVLMRVLPGATARTLAPLVHVERGLAPDPVRRLAALGADNQAEQLRLSKANAQQLGQLMQAVASGQPAAELGYRLGFQAARDVLLLRAAAMSEDVQGIDVAQRAATQSFPISAQDLMPRFQGAQIGKELRRLENEWIASGFSLTREDLLAKIQG